MEKRSGGGTWALVPLFLLNMEREEDKSIIIYIETKRAIVEPGYGSYSIAANSKLGSPSWSSKDSRKSNADEK